MSRILHHHSTRARPHTTAKATATAIAQAQPRTAARHWQLGLLGLSAALMVLATAMGARADDEDGRFGVHAKASTLGLGGEFSARLSETVGVRAGIYGFGLGVDTTADGIDYDLQADILNVGGYVDWHPFKNSFRLTAGVVWNDNGVSGTAVSGQSLQIGSTTYAPDEIGELSGAVTTNEFAPFIGFGWGGTAVGKTGWAPFVEFGAMFHGSPEANLVADIPADSPINLTPETRAQFDADLAAEVESFQNDVADFSVYPVFSIGLTYRF